MPQSNWCIKLTVTAGVSSDPDSRSPTPAAGIPSSVALSAWGIRLQGLLCSHGQCRQGGAQPHCNDSGTWASLLGPIVSTDERMCGNASCKLFRSTEAKAVVIPLIFLWLSSIHIIFMFSRQKWKDNISKKLSSDEFIKRGELILPASKREMAAHVSVLLWHTNRFRMHYPVLSLPTSCTIECVITRYVQMWRKMERG